MSGRIGDVLIAVHQGLIAARDRETGTQEPVKQGLSAP